MKSTQVSRIAILSALYVVLSFIPVSMFVGAGSFLSLSIVVTPIIAFLLSPYDALLCSGVSGLIVTMLNPGSAMFGIFTVLLPVFGAVGGSISFRINKGVILTSIFLTITILFYLYTRSGFIFWIIPHIVALLMLVTMSFFKTNRYRLRLLPYVATMCEQSIMLLMAILILKLPVLVFQVAFPLMIYERIFATIGSSIIISSLDRVGLNGDISFS